MRNLEELYIPDETPRNIGSLVELAQTLQFGLEFAGRTHSEEDFFTAIEMLGDTETTEIERSLFLHATGAVMLGKDRETGEADEIQVDKISVFGKLSDIRYVKVSGNLHLNSLCLNLTNFEVYEAEKGGYLYPGKEIPPTDRLVVPVLQIENLVAA